MFRILQNAFLLGLSLILSGCDLFPQRDAAANKILYQNTLSQLAHLEADGLLNPNTISFVFVHRYGTSFGLTQLLEGTDENGAALSAEDMVQSCIQEAQSTAPADVRGCLKQNYSTERALRYSHAGVAYKVPGEAWYVRQSLRSTETGEHFQWFGTLKDFIDIPLVETRIEVLVPTINFQSQLVRAVLTERAGDFLIDPDYNLVAKPFQDQEQMSNQYVLELAAAALRPTGTPITRRNIQEYLAGRGFQADIVLLGGLRSLVKLDALFPTVDLSEQPYVRNYEIGEFISVHSVQAFLTREGHIARRIEITNQSGI